MIVNFFLQPNALMKMVYKIIGCNSFRTKKIQFVKMKWQSKMIKTHQKSPEDIDFRFIEFIDIYGNENDCFGCFLVLSLRRPFKPSLRFSQCWRYWQSLCIGQRRRSKHNGKIINNVNKILWFLWLFIIVYRKRRNGIATKTEQVPTEI